MTGLFESVTHTHRHFLRFVVIICNKTTLPKLRDVETYEYSSSVSWLQLTHFGSQLHSGVTIINAGSVSTKTEASVTNAVVAEPGGSTRQNSRR
jgi:hypothetical protein